jgi:hypothetical protein
MLLGWLQGRGLLEMFTISVRYIINRSKRQLENPSMFMYEKKITRCCPCSFPRDGQIILCFSLFDEFLVHRTIMLCEILPSLGIYYLLRHFQQYFSYNVTVSFISGGNQSTQRKPLTCRKSLTNFPHNVVSSTPCMKKK